MTSFAIDSDIIERLNRGDRAAVEQVFRTYEPLLRMVVRRRMSAGLRSKFESVDIVQSAWVDLWNGFRRARWNFQNASQLRAFLIKATVNRLIDRVRCSRRPPACEHRVTQLELDGLAADADTPSEMVYAADLWKQLLASCPHQHQQVLQLKRQGWSAAQIAARVGMHESSIRRILAELRQQALRPRGQASSPPSDSPLQKLEGIRKIEQNL